MSLPITVNGNRAILKPNPDAKTITFLDKWKSHGYIATLGQQGNSYLLQQVIYDLNEVPFEKVQEVADKLDKQKFQCPVCQRLAEERAEAEEPQEEEYIEEVNKEPEVEIAEELPLDEDDARELMRAKAVKQLVGELDSLLLMKAMTGI